MEMIDHKSLRKIVSVIVILAFFFQFQSSIYLQAQSTDRVQLQFDKARDAYLSKQYKKSKKRLEAVIDYIIEEYPERKDILGQCYLMLGAIYENEKKGTLARENYTRAKKECGVGTVKNVDLNQLTIYRDVMDRMRIKELIDNAKKAYENGQYVKSRGIFEKLAGDVIKNNLDKNILRKCYLYKGAIYEKEENPELAEENYRLAFANKESLEPNSIDIDKLPILKKIIDIINNENQFEKSKAEFLNAQYNDSKSRLNRTIRRIINQGGQKPTLGKCYLLMGAIYEIEGKTKLAEEHYRRAKAHRTKSVYGINLKKFQLYKITMRDRVIEKPGKKKKKKFPILIVLGGIAVVAILAAILFKKKKPETYSLNVTRGDGIDGTPAGGSTTYNKGSTVSYNYTLQSGYTNLVVTLDGTTVSSSGTITMDQNHTLVASATAPATQYTLTVTRGEGVDGTPVTGTYAYDSGTTVDYSYALQNGYTNLVVTQDGSTVSTSDTITMNADHTLTAAATGSGPVVTITSHNNGETVSKRIDIEGTVQSVKTISKVELWVNNSLIVSGTSAAFSLRWNTKTVEDGTYTVKVIAYDTDNATGETQVSLVVNNEVLPSVTITSPANGSSIVRGTEVTIQATASSSVGITSVEFFVDGESIGTDSSVPYAITWYTTSYLEGSHVIRVVAYDNNGNSGEDQITVTTTSQ